MAGEDVQTLEQPDVVVTVDADHPPAPDVVVKTDGEAKDPAIQDLIDQHKELEAKSKASDEAKREAEQRAAAARQEAEQARRDAAAARAAATSSNLDTITTSLTAAQEAAEAAQRDIELAISNGDAKAQAEAQRRLARAEALTLRYDEAKSDIEARAKRPPQTERPADPVEAYAQNRAPQTAAWIRSHPDYVTNQLKQHKLQAAHSLALAEGIEPDTPEYFESVETFLGMRKVEKKADADAEVTDGDNAQRPGAAKKPAQRAVAPVAGSRGSGGAVDRNEVRLSPGEAAAATDGTHTWNYDDPSGQKKFKKGDPIGVQEFARRKLALTKQGAYDRTYETQ